MPSQIVWVWILPQLLTQQRCNLWKVTFPVLTFLICKPGKVIVPASKSLLWQSLELIHLKDLEDSLPCGKQMASVGHYYVNLCKLKYYIFLKIHTYIRTIPNTRAGIYEVEGKLEWRWRMKQRKKWKKHKKKMRCSAKTNNETWPSLESYC